MKLKNSKIISEDFDFNTIELDDDTLDTVGALVNKAQYNEYDIKKLFSAVFGLKSFTGAVEIEQKTMHTSPALIRLAKNLGLPVFKKMAQTAAQKGWQTVYMWHLELFKRLKNYPKTPDMLQCKDIIQELGVCPSELEIDLALSVYRSDIDYKLLENILNEYVQPNYINLFSSAMISPDSSMFILWENIDFCREYYANMAPSNNGGWAYIFGLTGQNIPDEGWNRNSQLLKESFDFDCLMMDTDQGAGGVFDMAKEAMSSTVDIKPVLTNVFQINSISGSNTTVADTMLGMPVIVKPVADIRNSAVRSVKSMSKVMAQLHWHFYYGTSIYCADYVSKNPSIDIHDLKKAVRCNYVPGVATHTSETEIEAGLTLWKNEKDYEFCKKILAEFYNGEYSPRSMIQISPDYSMYFITVTYYSNTYSKHCQYNKKYIDLITGFPVFYAFGLTGENIPEYARKSPEDINAKPKRTKRVKDDEYTAFLKKLMSKCTLPYKNVVNCEFGFLSDGIPYCHMWSERNQYGRIMNIDVETVQRRMQRYEFRSAWYLESDEMMVKDAEYDPLKGFLAKYMLNPDASVRTMNFYQTMLGACLMEPVKRNPYAKGEPTIPEVHIILALRWNDISKSVKQFNLGLKAHRKNPLKEGFDFNNLDMEYTDDLDNITPAEAMSQMYGLDDFINDTFNVGHIDNSKTLIAGTLSNMPLIVAPFNIMSNSADKNCDHIIESCIDQHWFNTNGINITLADYCVNNGIRTIADIQELQNKVQYNGMKIPNVKSNSIYYAHRGNVMSLVNNPKLLKNFQRIASEFFKDGSLIYEDTFIISPDETAYCVYRRSMVNDNIGLRYNEKYREISGKYTPLFMFGFLDKRKNSMNESFDFDAIELDADQDLKDMAARMVHKDADVMPIILDDLGISRLVGYKKIQGQHLDCPYMQKSISGNSINQSKPCQIHFSTKKAGWRFINELAVYVVDVMYKNRCSFDDAVDYLRHNYPDLTLEYMRKWSPNEYREFAKHLVDNLPEPNWNAIIDECLIDPNANKVFHNYKKINIYLAISPDFSAFSAIAWNGHIFNCIIGLTGYNVPDKCIPGMDAHTKAAEAHKKPALTPEQKVFRKFVNKYANAKIPTVTVTGEFGKFQNGDIYYMVKGTGRRAGGIMYFDNRDQLKMLRAFSNKSSGLNGAIKEIIPDELQKYVDDTTNYYVHKAYAYCGFKNTEDSPILVPAVGELAIFKPDAPSSYTGEIMLYVWASSDKYDAKGQLIDEEY